MSDEDLRTLGKILLGAVLAWLLSAVCAGGGVPWVGVPFP